MQEVLGDAEDDEVTEFHAPRPVTADPDAPTTIASLDRIEGRQELVSPGATLRQHPVPAIGWPQPPGSQLPPGSKPQPSEGSQPAAPLPRAGHPSEAPPMAPPRARPSEPPPMAPARSDGSQPAILRSPAESAPPPVATPNPAASPEVGPGIAGPMPRGAGGRPPPRKTSILSDARAAELSAARVAAAPGPAERERSEPHFHRVPGMPARIPLSPRPGRVALGIVLIGVGVWALTMFLPAVKPLSAAELTAYAQELSPDEIAQLQSARLSSDYYIGGNSAAVALLVFGLFVAVGGVLYRAQAETICRRCNRQVIGWKRAFGLQCPLDRHYARLNWLMLFASILFWGVVIATTGGLMYLVFA